jgi:DNA-binding IclR family transcriptional regulator
MSQSLARSCLLLTYLKDGPATLEDLASRLDVHKTTVWRLLRTLEDFEFVERPSPGGRFQLSVGLLQLSAVVLNELDLRTVARPIMKRLAAESRETVHLAVLRGDRAIYIDKIASIHPVQMNSQVGQVVPLHCSALGKAMLSELPYPEWPHLELTKYTDTTITSLDKLKEDCARAQVLGFALDRGEEEESMYCVASAMLGFEGSLAGAVSVAAPRSRVSLRQMRALGKHTIAAASDIARAMGARTGQVPKGFIARGKRK